EFLAAAIKRPISALVRYSRVQTEEFTMLGADRPPVRFPTIAPNPEVHTPMLAIRTFLILAFALVAIASSLARADNKCYSSRQVRCDARSACEGRNPGPNCFTNFNKCRTCC